jgi:hypothetical protein
MTIMPEIPATITPNSNWMSFIASRFEAFGGRWNGWRGHREKEKESLSVHSVFWFLVFGFVRVVLIKEKDSFLEGRGWQESRTPFSKEEIHNKPSGHPNLRR